MPSDGNSSQPLEGVTLFVEYSVGVHVAHTLRAAGIRVVWHQDVLPDNADDVTYLGRCAREGWVPLTADSDVHTLPPSEAVDQKDAAASVQADTKQLAMEREMRCLCKRVAADRGIAAQTLAWTVHRSNKSQGEDLERRDPMSGGLGRASRNGVDCRRGRPVRNGCVGVAGARRTPWGEIAFQLGGAQHDEVRTAPATVRRFPPRDRPVLILVDEPVNFMSRSRKSTPMPAGRSS